MKRKGSKKGGQKTTHKHAPNVDTFPYLGLGALASNLSVAVLMFPPFDSMFTGNATKATLTPENEQFFGNRYVFFCLFLVC